MIAIQMKHDYSYEKQIINNSIQFVENIKTNFNSVIIIFRDINTGNRTKFEVLNFNNFSINLDDPKNMTDNKLDNIQQTLIGLSFEERDDRILYCIKTDDYEVFFESNNHPKIEAY